MTWLIIKVSGVSMLERTMKNTKPGFEDYVKRTSAFIPWFPKKI
jgi:steroid 5-alpha reductase family enzyme